MDFGENIFLTDNAGKRKLVGHIRNKQFRKVIYGSKHIYRTTNSIGIDEEVWRTIIMIECDMVVVLDKETNTYYSARVSVIDKLKDYLWFKPHRKQIMLPLKHMDKMKRK